MVPKRCRNFDDEGQAIAGGCRRPKCGFVHPGEREWDTAISTFRNFSSFRGRRDSSWNDIRSPTSPSLRRDPKKSVDYYRDRDASRQRHSRSSRYSRSPSRSPRRSSFDRSSIASSKETEAGPSRIEEVAMNIDPSSLPTPPPMDHTTFFAQAQNPPTGPSASRLAIARRSPRHVSPTPAVESTSTPPPPPPGPVPMNPPLPLPEVPETLTLEVAQPQVEQSHEEKFALWEERLKAFAASVKAREQLTELEKEISAAQDVIASTFFQTLPEVTKSSLTDQLNELIQKREAAKAESDRHVESLIQSGYWPVLPPSANSETDRLQKDHEEIVKYVKDLHQTANEMKMVLGEITGLKQPPRLFLPDSSDEEDGADNAMDVDEKSQPVPSSSSKTLVEKPLLPTRKRRQPQPEEVGEPTPTQAELNEVVEQLLGLEAIADTLQNDIVEHDRELKDDFEQRLSNKADAINAQREEELQARDEKRKRHDAAVAARIKSMKEVMQVQDAQVGELAGDMGDILLKVDRLEAELEAQKEQRAESMKRVDDAKRQLAEYRKSQQENAKKIETLKLAVKAYLSRPASPPPTPTIPPPAFILQALEDPLTQAVRTSVQPLIQDLRNDMENLVKGNNSELYSTVWEKLSHPLRVLELIRARVNGMPPTATTATTSTVSGNAPSASTSSGGNPYPPSR